MTTIKLNHNYFVEVDENNFTLKSEYVGKKTNKTVTKIHGYYPRLEIALKDYIKLALLDENDAETIALHELLSKVKAVCDETIAVIMGGTNEK